MWWTNYPRLFSKRAWDIEHISELTTQSFIQFALIVCPSQGLLKCIENNKIRFETSLRSSFSA